MRPIPKPTRSIEDVLTRLHARLSLWEVRALFLGAQASTNLRVGPQHLLEDIFGPDRGMGESLEDANANLQSIMWLWNTLVQDHEAGQVRLSPLAFGDPPVVAELVAAVQRRSSEITWLTRGIDAGGDDPSEFGTDGEGALRGLAEAAAFLKAYEELLGRTDHPQKELAGARQSIEQLTGVVENLIEDLLAISDDVRREALAAFQECGEKATDDGLPAQRTVRVGRNDPCPCGSR